MTDTSADYYAAVATIYRDLATMVSVVFGFMAAVLVGLIAAEATSQALTISLGGLAKTVSAIVFVLGLFFTGLCGVTLHYNVKAVRAKRAEPAQSH